MSLLHLSFGRKLVPSKVQGSVAVISGEFSLNSLQPEGFAIDNFGNGEESKHLVKNELSVLGSKKSIPGLKTIGNVSSSRESNSSGSDKVTNDGKHGDASVLEFVFSECVELFLVSIGNKVQRIPESKLKIIKLSNNMGEK